MWVGELLDAENNCAQQYFMRGPTIKIGRSVENSLVFGADKSISRMHAEIVVDSATSTLHIVDLASRYGSSVNGAKLQGNVPFPVENGAVARFGVGTARIRFTRRSYAYCTTRLEKAEKDKLKRCAKITGGRIVTQVEHATHVVANKVAATVKMLTALVVPLKMVRAEWLSFAEGSNAAELIPREEDFAPAPSDDVKVHDPACSRSALLASYTIFLLNQFDIQYAAICRACGATLVDCAKEEEEKGVSALDLITQNVQQQQNNNSNSTEVHKYCLFFDESRGIECDKILMDECREALNNREDSTLHWLTAGKLAASIITFAPPVLFQDPPKASKVPGGGASQSQNSAMTAGGHSHQQRMMGASQSQSQFPFSPLASSSRAVVPQTALVPHVVSAVPPVQAAVVHTAHRNVSEQRALPPLPPSAAQFAKHASVASVASVAVGVTRIDSTRTIAGTLVEHTLAETAAAVVAPLVSTDRRMSVVKEEPQDVVSVPVPNATATTTTATSTAIVNKKRGREEEPEPEAAVSSITSNQASAAAANKDYQEESEDAFFQETKPPQPSASTATVMPAHKRAKPSAFTTTTASPGTSPVNSPRYITSKSSRNDEMDVSVTVPVTSKASTSATTTAMRTVDMAAVPSLSAATTSSTSSSTSNPSRRSTTSTNYNYRNQDVQQEGDWVEALRGADRTLAVHLKQTQVAREKQPHSKDNDAHDEAQDSEADEPVRRLPSACVIEKADLIGAFIGDHSEPRRIMNGSQASAGSSASSATTSNTGNVRNVKVFRKNKICSVGVRERMSFTHKQLVLPKESERQIQLRLEADARDELERYADHMMSEKFAATSKRTALK